MRLARLVNQYVSDQAPWATVKEDRERAGTVLYVVLQCIDNLKLLFTPFLPFSSQALHELLGYDDALAGDAALRAGPRRATAMPYTVLTGDYTAWAGAGNRASSRRGERSASRSRSSRSSIRSRSSRRSSSGWSGPPRRDVPRGSEPKASAAA